MQGPGALILLACLAAVPAAAAGAEAERAATQPALRQHARVVILCAKEPPGEPALLEREREALWTAPGLRMVRGLHRIAGFDAHPPRNRSAGVGVPPGHLVVAGVALVVLLVALGLAMIRPTRGRRFAALVLAAPAAGFLAALAWGSATLSRLDRFDRAAPLAAQTAIDVALARGLDFVVFHRWADFADFWRQGLGQGEIPCGAVIWAGLPEGADEAAVSGWLYGAMVDPLVHLGLGPHLPADYRSALCRLQAPVLDWADGSPRSVLDRASTYGRQAAWRVPGEPTGAGAYAFGKGVLAYVPRADDADTLDELLLSCWRERFSIPLPLADTEGVAALRMDDPGAAQALYLEGWKHPPLSTAQWDALARTLAEAGARLTVGYTPAWVDDGDLGRGKLFVGGNLVQPRVPGAVHPSHLVRFEPTGGGPVYDLVAQAAWLKAAPPVIDLALHGYTHITPDRKSWLAAPDRFDNADWYREFRATERRPFRDRPAEAQRESFAAAAALYRDLFGRDPDCLIPPGNESSPDTAGLCEILFDRTLAVRGRRCRVIRTLDGAKPSAELVFSRRWPSVIMFHDGDVAKNPDTWLADRLAAWRGRGLREFVSLYDLHHRLRQVPDASAGSPGRDVVLSVSGPFALLLPRGHELDGPPPGLALLSFDPGRGLARLRPEPRQPGRSSVTLRLRRIAPPAP